MAISPRLARPGKCAALGVAEREEAAGRCTITRTSMRALSRRSREAQVQLSAFAAVPFETACHRLRKTCCSSTLWVASSLSP